MSDISPRVVNDIHELLKLTELTDIVFYEVRGKRLAEATDRDMSIRIALRKDDHSIEVRCRATIAGAGGEYLTDAAAIFSSEIPIEIDESVLAEFVERVGVMSVYPYLRESISQSAAKLGLDRPILKLLRPGDVRVTPGGTESES